MANNNNSSKSHLFDWLSNDITEKLNEYFALSSDDDKNVTPINVKKIARDRQYKFWLAIEYILKKKIFHEKLLFKEGDYVNKLEANFYLTRVIQRKVELANKLNEEPTSMHKLLECYLQEACDDNWYGCKIVRSKTLTETPTNEWADFFKLVAATLKGIRLNLRDNYSVVSKNRIDLYGPYFLSVKGNTVQVAEELSLLDVFAALPIPIKRQAPAYYGTEKNPLPKNSADKLKIILETLNHRYGLLRSLRLKPEDWYYSESFSTTQLEELHNIVKRLRKDNQQHFRQGKALDEYGTFKRIFFELRGDKKNYAGFMDYQSCYEFYAGHIKYQITQHPDSDDHDVPYIEPQDSLPSGLDDLSEYPSYYPHLFNPVTAYLWELIIADGDVIGLHGKGAVALLKDDKFIGLIAHHPELGYADLSDRKRINRLQQELKEIFNKFNDQ